ncbi:MAG: hypothetical protein Q8L93_11265 [Rhodocyclaceae bacterium]|nr:hypothetical protein [Rhodocyclaceae bacterium]
MARKFEPPAASTLENGAELARQALLKPLEDGGTTPTKARVRSL